MDKVGLNKRKINSSTRLTKTDIEDVMSKENDILIKTFFIVMYETGMRPGELRTRKWSDITFNTEGGLTEINCFMTKNKKHKTVFVDEATFYLRKLQEESKSKYVFPSREKKKKGKDEMDDYPIGDSTATRWINILGKHINKKIYPYLLRHTRSHELYELADGGKLSETMVAKFLGHSKSMREVYARISKKGIKNASMKVIYKNEDLPEAKKHELEVKYESVKDELESLRAIVQRLSDEDLKNRPNYIKKNGKIIPVNQEEWTE